MKNVVISNGNFEEIKERISEDGAENFHVLADFDRTLTKAIVDGQKSPTVIAQLRNGGYLDEDYAKRAHELFDIYHPIEIDSSISDEEKNNKMNEWWKKHFDLIVEKNLTKEIIDDVVNQREIVFRDGVLDFLDFLNEKEIPLIILSASVGDFLDGYFRKEGKRYKNVHIVSNFFVFKGNKVVGVKGKIIHSLNKHETILKDFPIYSEIKDRKNVLLLGDGLGDLGMIEGFDYENLLKVGFLNENVEKNLESYKKGFDVVLTNDADFSFVNELVEEMLG